MKLCRKFACVGAALVLCAAPAPPSHCEAVKYAFSDANSRIAFTGTRPLAREPGHFEHFRGEIALEDGDVEAAHVNVTIDMASVTTRHDKLSEHLRSPDFFDVASHPQAEFHSTRVTRGRDGYAVVGDLTLHGVTKQIAFPATIAMEDRRIHARAAFALNRYDFGIAYEGIGNRLIRPRVDVEIVLDAVAMEAASRAGMMTGPRPVRREEE